MQDDLALALELADLADAITLERFLASDLAVETKPDLTPVTEADRAAEQAIRERLALSRPDDAILGEEFGAHASAESRRRWIVDPIDGTKNYVRGIPVWATLIALQDGDQLVLGVASAPALHRRWWAARGSGAFARDGLGKEPRQITVSGVAELADAQLCFPGFDDTWHADDEFGPLLALAKQCWRSRGFGDFWQYMLIAEGAAEIACEPVVSLWDLAAPLVIVEEAGGRFTDRAGVRTAAGGDAVASNGLLHEAVLALIGR